MYYRLWVTSTDSVQIARWVEVGVVQASSNAAAIANAALEFEELSHTDGRIYSALHNPQTREWLLTYNAIAGFQLLAARPATEQEYQDDRFDRTPFEFDHE